MFDALAKPFLANALHLAMFAIPICAAGYFGYDSGQTQAARVYEVRLAKQEASHAETMRQIVEQRLQEQTRSQQEQTRLTDLVHQVGWQLLQTQGQLARSQVQLKERIADATLNDGQAWTGLGPDSLRLYRAALGYPERDPGLPAADAGDAGEASQASAAKRGIPPADLLNHAADYGRWCQELETRLDSYIRLYQEASHG
ncbi:hypothetical protein [Chromobacterium violaceum]|uniref:Uncharacterized protein n=1 Tax=Chromobacterium violaceum TaxID=536 RepID=A0AAX2MDF7_CHRVL|nr:hypothetical protein [Chromobacterium violaceum]OLZ76972.1 hypothetical protein BS642_15200 [Chromobacterium violaceum]STB70170.1 Uncharacterised protein [Chromobacterium violaceum]SUX34814.1 Uncharacterised protein [Chromobacterium violaceum]